MPAVQSANSLSRCFPLGWAALLMAAAIVSFGHAAEDELEIDGAEIIRGEDGAFDARDARISKDGRELRAGRLQYDPKTGTVTAQEGVVIHEIGTPAGSTFSADAATYLIEKREAHATGRIELADAKGNLVNAVAMTYSFATRSGVAHTATVSIAGSPARLAAEHATFGEQGYELDEAAYTTCKTDDPDWLLSAGHISLAPDQTVEAEDVKLTFLGVPVLYLPRLSYSLDDRRKSGFLPPQVRIAAGGRSEIDIPYYVNIAPNADAEIGARVISSRGPLVHADGRLLLRDSYSEAGAAAISDSELGRNRYSWRLSHDASIAPQWSLDVHAEGVSDDTYGTDFLSGFGSTRRHYPRSAELGYRAGPWSALVAADGYQTIQEEKGRVEKPFARIPALEAAYARQAAGLGVQAAAGFTRFERDEDPDGLTGGRLNVRAAASRSWQDGPAQLEIVGGASGASYGAAGAANWVVPHATAGVSYELARSASPGGANLLQTLRPRLLLGAVRRSDYADVPVYDTARAAFSVEHLYEANSFVGGDRFGDAPFATFGIETGLWDEAARRSVLNFRFAQRYLLSDSRATVGASPAPAAGLSNALADLRFAPAAHLMMVSQLEWSPEGRWEQVNLEGKAVLPTSAYALQYALSRNDADEDESLVGASIQRTVAPRLQLAADATYSLEQSRLSELTVGFQVSANCNCWSFDAVMRREAVAEHETDTEVLMQVSFRGLTDLGSRSYGELRESVRDPL